MKSWFWLVVAALLASPAHAKRKPKRVEAAPTAAAPATATASDLVTLPCQWSPGQRFHYRYERYKVENRRPILAQMTARRLLEVEVVASDSSQTRFDFRLAEAELEGPEEGRQAAIGMLGAYPVPPLVIDLRGGEALEVVNYIELADAAEEPMRRAFPPEVPAEMIDNVMAVYRSPDTGPVAALRDPSKLFGLHCVAMQPGQVLETPLAVPNPFGGDPLAATSRVEAVSIDAERGELTLQLQTALNEESVRALIQTVASDLLPDDGPLPKEEMERVLAKMPPMTTTVQGEMVYSVTDGFPVRVDVTESMGGPAHPGHRSNRWVFERVEAPE